ncbi:MAG: anti-phage dCTP deaminase [Pseudomonas sp.]|nr:anti-phage dCTP deaminase [Pseudomonas sp.]
MNHVVTMKSPKIPTANIDGQPGSQVLQELRSNELFVGVVGPAGAGSGTAANILKSFFEDQDYQTEIIKVSALIRALAQSKSFFVPREGARKSIESVVMMQDRGDEIRKGEKYTRPEDHTAIARLVLEEISVRREQSQSQDLQPSKQKKRAFIIDSLRHPAEVTLLREVYKDSFSLIGIVCNPEERKLRILENLFEPSKRHDQDAIQQVKKFLNRDENAGRGQDHGQHVADTFHEADFFVDNSVPSKDPRTTGMNDHLQRFVSLLTHSRIIRPTIAETAMHHAHSSQMRSACLSRQVGAALVDKNQNIVSTGTNDVPKAGGGLYGQDFVTDIISDHQCAYANSPHCSSNRMQNEIISELIEDFPSLETADISKESLIDSLRGTRIGGLIEFSRAVHAEMDAILSAAVSGVSPKGCRMYVTTYPCHYCARHIVAAGIDEVQFIEPYPKSKATDLHSDSITIEDSANWLPPSEGGDKVLFKPFVGVAPRLYPRAFLKDRDYKNKTTGEYQLGDKKLGSVNFIYTESYLELERKLSLES